MVASGRKKERTTETQSRSERQSRNEEEALNETGYRVSGVKMKK